MAERKKNPVVQARNEEIRAKYLEGRKASELAVDHQLSEGSIYQVCKGLKRGKNSIVEKKEPCEAELAEKKEDSLDQMLVDRLGELINRIRGMVDLYESEGFYENRLISTVKNHRLSRMGIPVNGVVLIIQVPDMKKAKEAARKGFVRFFPEK